MRIAVIGGAGGMGHVTVADAARSAGVEEVRIVDLDRTRAEALADALGRPVVVGRGEGFADAVRGVDAVVNAAGHALNLRVMEACLETGAHYTDLGGLFHVALEQFSLDGAFREAGLAAAISMGSAPGVTNMLAAAAAERLDTVESIEIADAIIPGREPEPTDPTYRRMPLRRSSTSSRRPPSRFSTGRCARCRPTPAPSSTSSRRRRWNACTRSTPSRRPSRAPTRIAVSATSSGGSAFHRST